MLLGVGGICEDSLKFAHPPSRLVAQFLVVHERLERAGAVLLFQLDLADPLPQLREGASSDLARPAGTTDI